MSNPITPADYQDAVVELSSKTSEKIEGETAIKWGARALAAWSLAKAQQGTPNYLFWFREAVAYKHESLEHAGWAPAGLLEALKAQLGEVP